MADRTASLAGHDRQSVNIFVVLIFVTAGQGITGSVNSEGTAASSIWICKHMAEGQCTVPYVHARVD